MLNNLFKQELKSNISLSIPIIIGQLGVVLMAVADNIMVGRLLGKTALGSSGVANAVAFLIASLAVGGLPVVAPMVSKALAENNSQDLKKLFSATMAVAFIYSIVLSFLGFLAFQFFNYLGQPEEINIQAPPYMIIIMASNVVLFAFLALKQFADGFSQPKIAMYITIIGLCFNVLFNFLLIEGIGIFPKLNLNGAGWATFITRLVMAVVLGIYVFNNSKFKKLFSDYKFKIAKSQIIKILRRSIPGGFQFFFEIGAFATAVIMMGWINQTALAAHNIAINIASSTYMMATGISFASGIRVGDAWGRKDNKAIRLAGNAGYLLVFIFMVMSMLFIFLLKRPLLELYISDEIVIQAALPLLSIAALFQLSDGIQVVGLGVLRGLADIRIPTFFTFLAYWIIALPVGYILSFKLGFGAVGIWLGLLIGLTVSALLLYLRYRNIVKKFGRR